MDSKYVSTGASTMGLLWVALIILKATGYIGWSWFIVITSYVWIPLAVLLAWGFLALLAFLLYAAYALVKK